MKINKKLVQNIANATNEEEYIKAQMEYAEAVAEEIVSEAKGSIEDTMTMNDRGLRVLTSEETKFYNAVMSTGGLAGIEKMMPTTIVDRIFEDLEKSHPLLNEIQFMNTTGLTKFYVRKTEADGAQWGKLGSEITKKLDSTFDVVEVGQHKLTAFVPVSNDMLKLGPVWIDKYVRAILGEAIVKSLEDKIINGTGVDCPTGMLRDVDQPFNSGTGYPERAAVKIDDLSPKTLGEKLMAPLLKDRDGATPNVVLVCNPADYWSKVFPLTTVQSADGHYVFNVLPINAKVVQSSAVPANKMIACIPQDYFLGVGMNAVVQFSDEYHFLEDERIYMTKMLTNGRPLKGSSFITFDISKLGEKSK